MLLERDVPHLPPVKEMDFMHSLLKAGEIKRNKSMPSQKSVHYEMRFMDESHLTEIVKLQNIITHFLDDKEMFRTHSPEYFLEHFQIKNSTIGTFTSEGLIGYSILYFPGDREDSFGFDLSLDGDDMDQVVHLATVAVHPAYRGNSLQRIMQGIHLEIAKGMGYEHACCMVSPKNRPSLQNIFWHGLMIKALKLKFDHRLRYIMHKNLSHPLRDCHEEFKINNWDLKTQSGLLNRGYIGLGMIASKDGFLISYGKEGRSSA